MMNRKICLAAIVLALPVWTQAAPPVAPTDQLGRANPRATVTAFLEACHDDNYGKAAQYLDLTQVPARLRASQGPQLAKDLEQILNADTHFDVLKLTQDPQGNLSDNSDPSIEHVTTITSNGVKSDLSLQRIQPATGPAYWLFSTATISSIPKLVPVPSTESVIEAHLPRFLVSVRLLETPLWKWLALALLALLVAGGFRLVVRLFLRFLSSIEVRSGRRGAWRWLQAVLEPVFVLLSVMVFGIAEQFVAPAALSRLYIGRALLLVVVASFAWGLINLLDYFLTRMDSLLNPRQRIVSHSLIYLARKVSKIVVAIFAAIVVLDNWGFNMTTIIAGLGVGGIAVALAAQQTIANVFGGVSIIGDAPVMIGDFGNFGGLMGTVEEIGMRSTRVRTLNRTLVSVPNSSFAGMNLENYAVRDKILFNPTLQVKRATPKDTIRRCITALGEMLAHNKNVQVGPAPVRITAYSSASFSLEVFAYVLTSDVDEFYKIEAELFLAIDDVVTSLGVELA
jgi:MscS family membrane protein